MPENLVRDRGLRHIYLDQVLLGRLDTFANGLRNLFGLAGSVPHHAFGRIAHDHQRRKAHVLAALDHFGHAIDADNLILEVHPVSVQLLLAHHLGFILCMGPGTPVRGCNVAALPVLVKTRERVRLPV